MSVVATSDSNPSADERARASGRFADGSDPPIDSVAVATTTGVGLFDKRERRSLYPNRASRCEHIGDRKLNELGTVAIDQPGPPGYCRTVVVDLDATR